MKIGKIFTAGCAALWLGTALQAQSAGDLLRLSQYNYSFSTARSAALGGAFTSLGADLSSIGINPAGLGMYRGSEFGISPTLTSSDMENHYLGQQNNYSKTRFGLGNVGVALNLYQGSGALTSFTLGIGYNKLADFNTSSIAYGKNARNSITEIFAEDLYGIPSGDLAHPKDDPYAPFRKFGVDRWGGILGYQTGILDPMEDGISYSPWNSLAQSARIDPSLANIDRGSIGEYAISGGVNIENILYLGLTLGIQDISYRNENRYTETYLDNPLSLDGMTYIRMLDMNGTGVNVKFGLTVRPVPNLRIGMAIHSPTYIRIDEEYVEYMSADYKSMGNGELLDSPYLKNSYNFRTPTRFLAGLSYTLPNIGLITADYERVWYNDVKMRHMDGANWSFEQSLNDQIRDDYRTADNFRVGVELTPVKNFYVRGGYAYYGDCIKGDRGFINQSSIKSYENISVGLGFRFDNFYVDAAYIHTSYKYAPSQVFYFEDRADDFVIASGEIDTRQDRNTVTLSAGFKF